MTDIYSREKRSELMSNIRSANTKLETEFFKYLEESNVKGFEKHADIEGRPDVAFLKEKLGIFLDGEYWHGWGYPNSLPKTKKSYWNKKILRNIERDSEVNSILKTSGWHVLRFWERHIKKEPEKCAEKIKKTLKSLRKIRSAEIVAIDWFCGGGGITRGLMNAGIRVAKGIDFDETAKRTYEENNFGSIFVKADIRDLSADKIMDGVELNKGQKLLFAACAPCQPFSSQNKNKTHKDERRPLLVDFSKMVTEIKPDFIFVENVPGLGGKHGKGIYDKFKEALREEKYDFVEAIVNAKAYGVPQNRRRLILLASKLGVVNIPESTHGNEKADFVTVKETISKYPPIRAGSSFEPIPNHTARSLGKLNMERIRKTPKDGGGRMDWPEHLILDCHKKRRGYSDVYGRMKWDAPAPTLTCKCTSLSNGRFGHPEQNRAISAREAAALQTFEDDYVFYGGMNNVTRHIGNAVPVRLAEVFGAKFVKMAKETNKKSKT